MDIVDDSQLVRLTSQETTPLFRVLDNASVMTPLLLVLAILPGLYALENRTLDESAARWGLRSLDVFSASQAAASPSDATFAPTEPLRYQPPLGTWLTAAAMSILGPSYPVGLVVTSYLATLALVLIVYLLCQRLMGVHCAFWTTVLLSCHGPLLIQLQNPAPCSVAIFFAVLTFWAFVAHRQQAEGLMSFKLLIGGFALGQCLLSGGPLSFIVVAVLLVHVFGLRGESVSGRKGPKSERRTVWSGWPALWSLFMLVFTAFLLGGWWVPMMVWRDGMEFWTGWLTGGTTPFDKAEVVTGSGFQNVLIPQAAREFIHLQGGLLGLSLLGCWCAIRELWRTVDEARRRRLQFLVAWAGGALLIWTTLMRNTTTAEFSVALWKGFLLVPLVVFAAFAIEEISMRRVSVAVVLGCTSLSFVGMHFMSIRPGTLDGGVPGAGINMVISSGVVVLAIMIALVWLIRLYVRDHDSQQRALIAVLLVVPIVMNAAQGLLGVRLRTNEDTTLAECRREYASINDVDTCAVVSESPPPVQLWYMLRSRWPKARLHSVKSWDAALSQALAENPSTNDKFLVVDWSRRDTRPANIRVGELVIESATSPQIYRDRQLRTYEVTGN